MGVPTLALKTRPNVIRKLPIAACINAQHMEGVVFRKYQIELQGSDKGCSRAKNAEDSDAF